MKNQLIKHSGDCSIYRVSCDICDCGKLRQIISGNKEVKSEIWKVWAKHLKQIEEIQAIPHQYHCPLDGTQLYEIGFGVLMCKMCNIRFIPAYDAQYGKDHPDECMPSLSWVENKEQEK